MSPILHYENNLGKLWCGDALEWLESLSPSSANLIIADPPYNINKAEWDVFSSHEEYIKWSRKWMSLASRALTNNGTLYIYGFSELLADIKVAGVEYFAGCRWLIWHYKNKANLGKDWGRSHESIIHFRKSKTFTMNTDLVRVPYGSHTLKYPSRSQAITSHFGSGKQRQKQWTPHPLGAKPKDVFDIPTICNGMEEKTPHPTQKPEELIRKLVLASSNEGDMIIDPFSGSGTTAVVATQLGRCWQACDLSKEYNDLAVQRLIKNPKRSINEWVQLDKQNVSRRTDIRKS